MSWLLCIMPNLRDSQQVTILNVKPIFHGFLFYAYFCQGSRPFLVLVVGAGSAAGKDAASNGGARGGGECGARQPLPAGLDPGAGSGTGHQPCSSLISGAAGLQLRICALWSASRGVALCPRHAQGGDSGCHKHLRPP